MCVRARCHMYTLSAKMMHIIIGHGPSLAGQSHSIKGLRVVLYRHLSSISGPLSK